MPLTLFATQRSPFSRRITVTLLRQSIPFELKLLEPPDLYPPLPQLLLANPQGQVPVFVTEKGQGIPDSSTILEYLDENVHPIWPKEAQLRINARVASTLCTGILTSAVKEFLNQNTKSPFRLYRHLYMCILPLHIFFWITAQHYCE